MGLNITVNHPVSMGKSQSVGRLHTYTGYGLLIGYTGESRTQTPRAEPLPLHQAHHVLTVRPLLPGAEYLDDIGMAQPGQYAGFIFKSLADT